MNMVSRLKSFLSRKDYSPSAPPTKEDRIWGLLGAGNVEALSVASSLRAGHVIASGMGMMPVEVAGSAEITALLNEKPNELMTGVELVEMLTLHAVFTGAGRAYVERDTINGKIAGIYPIPPAWQAGSWEWSEADGDYVVSVTIPDRGDAGGYVGHFTRDSVLEITGPRWEMLCGLNVTRACSKVLGLSSRMQDRQSQLTSSATPFGILVMKDGASGEAIKALKESWSRQFGSSGIAVVDFDASFSQMIQTAEDTQLVEMMQFQIEETARLFGVHPYMLMKTAGSGAQSAISDILLFHQVHTMGPWIRRWESALRRSVTKGRDVNFDESALLRTTPTARAEIHARALGAGGNAPWMTPNEVREKWGLDPRADGARLSPAPLQGGDDDDGT